MTDVLEAPSTATPAVDKYRYAYAREGPRENQHWADRYLLCLRDVKAVFDGFTALDIKDLGIAHNELRVVVGPNGAGKTTMCDVISGLTKPASGDVYFDGEIITGQTESEIASRGVGRKFQIPNVFDSLSVMDNMRLALPDPEGTREAVAARMTSRDPRLGGSAMISFVKSSRDAWRSFFGRPTSNEINAIENVLGRVNLLEHRDKLAKNLSHGQRQWLAISALILARPKLLLVDEPAAGLTDAETELTARLLSELKGHHTLIVIEHDMEFVRQLQSRVTVLNEGKVLAEGSLDEIQANPEVIEAYLRR